MSIIINIYTSVCETFQNMDFDDYMEIYHTQITSQYTYLYMIETFGNEISFIQLYHIHIQYIEQKVAFIISEICPNKAATYDTISAQATLN